MSTNKKHKLSSEPYKGVRDFYPEDMFIQNYIFETMRTTAENFGYLEYSASILESAELYEAKSGEEIINEQTYTFTDRGDRRVTLRPEMTPSAARMVAARRRELPFPLRWYSIPNLYRYERPQRGRLREHWQLNCDIFLPAPSEARQAGGFSAEFEADVEIIALASAIMKAYGAEESNFEIKINNRKALNQKLEEKGLSGEQIHKIYKLLDKKNKIDTFEEELAQITDVPLDLATPDAESKSVIERLKRHGVSNVAFSDSVVRGFDYYSGIVFEVFDTAPENNRSLFGGGRYDHLVDIFGVDPVPAVGFGMGDVTIRDFLETHNLLPEYVPTTDLYIATTAPEYISAAQELAERVRAQGVSVATNLLDKKIGDQIKTAEKQSIPFVLVVGEDEIKSKQYKLKELSTGKEIETAEDAIGETIWSTDI